jgi:hypothetical protein
MRRITHADVVTACWYFAPVVGRAHSRQIGAGEQPEYQLLGRTRKNLDALVLAVEKRGGVGFQL